MFALPLDVVMNLFSINNQGKTSHFTSGHFRQSVCWLAVLKLSYNASICSDHCVKLTLCGGDGFKGKLWYICCNKFYEFDFPSYKTDSAVLYLLRKTGQWHSIGLIATGGLTQSAD